jgi:hypothetical protein
MSENTKWLLPASAGGVEIGGIPVCAVPFGRIPERERFSVCEESISKIAGVLGLVRLPVDSWECASHLFLEAVCLGDVAPPAPVYTGEEDVMRFYKISHLLGEYRYRYDMLLPPTAVSVSTPEVLRDALLSDIMGIVAGADHVKMDGGCADACRKEVFEGLLCKRCLLDAVFGYWNVHVPSLCPVCTERLAAHERDLLEKPFCGMCMGTRATVAYLSFCLCMIAFGLHGAALDGRGQDRRRFFDICSSLICFAFEERGRGHGI